jgi:hypothetical protein
MSNFLSYIEFYYITTRCTPAAHTQNREQKNGKDENKKDSFCTIKDQIFIKFLHVYFYSSFFSLVSWENGKFIDWSIVNLEIIETALLLRNKNPFSLNRATTKKQPQH